VLTELHCTKHRPYVEILGILLLAFALRLIALGSREIWYDDAFSIFLARRDLSAIADGTAADTMPPLYYLLLHFWMMLGDDPFTLRFLSVMLSMLIVASVYATARKMFDKRAARNAALFTAIAPFQIYHAQELRMYGLLALALLWYLHANYELRSFGSAQDKITNYEFLALATALALYSHNLAIITLAAANFYHLWRRDWNALLKLLIAQIAGVLLFVPWLLYVPGQLEKIQRSFWTLRPGLVDILQMLVEFTTNLPLPAMLLPVALFASLGIFALALLETLRAIRRGAPAALGMVIAFAVFPPIVLFILSYFVRPIFVPRGVILSSLAYYILLGWLAARVRPQIEVGLILAAALVIVPALAFQYSYNEFPRSPFRAANEFLQSNVRAGDAVVHDNKLTFFPMRYYAPALAHTFVADPPGSSNDTFARGSMDAMQIYPTPLEDATMGKARVWFVIFQRALDEAASENRPHGNYSWMESHFKQISLTRFNDLNVYLYQR
jgi:4-amino-4-deoxy-L-arabinose transferase-like glycosyltransferase